MVKDLKEKGQKWKEERIIDGTYYFAKDDLGVDFGLKFYGRF